MDTYEKKYKESLALMVDCIPDEDGYVHVRPQDIFPELRESEDERIRKEILQSIRDNMVVIHKDECIAWLEKQGTSYTKRDVDDAFVEGMALAKDELEKQGERDKPTYNTYSKDVQLTQEEYDKKRVSYEAIIKEVEAYKKGLEDAQKIFEKQGKQKQKPTNEDMKEALQTEYEKGRADAIAQMQQEWSEEDERAIGIIKTALEHPYDMEGKWDRKFALDWLKSLKQRYTWKPSDEQMNAFGQVYDWYNTYFAQSPSLNSLYNDLKKLKGE